MLTVFVAGGRPRALPPVARSAVLVAAALVACALTGCGYTSPRRFVVARNHVIGDGRESDLGNPVVFIWRSEEASRRCRRALSRRLAQIGGGSVAIYQTPACDLTYVGYLHHNDVVELTAAQPACGNLATVRYQPERWGIEIPEESVGCVPADSLSRAAATRIPNGRWVLALRIPSSSESGEERWEPIATTDTGVACQAKHHSTLEELVRTQARAETIAAVRKAECLPDDVLDP